MWLVLGALVGVAITGCGEDRAALARKAVKTYWTDISHAKLTQAYHMMTSGNRSAKPLKTYGQDMLGFMQTTGGVTPRIGKAEVHDDRAVVAVSLYSPKSPVPLNAYQHLFWEGSGWKISDENGGLSHKK
jgi:hypothetical protein